MIDLMIHFNTPLPVPHPFLLWILLRNCAKSKMLTPGVFSGALLMDMLPVAQCPEYIRTITFQQTLEAVLVYYCPHCA